MYEPFMPLVEAPPTCCFSLVAGRAEEGAVPLEGLSPLLPVCVGGMVSMAWGGATGIFAGSAAGVDSSIRLLPVAPAQANTWSAQKFKCSLQFNSL